MLAQFNVLLIDPKFSARKMYCSHFVTDANVHLEMFLFVPIISVLIGAVATREADIDINRVRLVSEETYSDQQSSHERRSIHERYQRTNDYDDHSSGHLGLLAPLQLHVPRFHASSTKAPVKVYQPREDPRLFYQSDAYLKGSNGQNVNQEVSFIYPGKDSVRAGENKRRSMSLREENWEHNMIDGFNVCVRCPHDRTVIARAGSDRVLLQTPRLFTCFGQRAPRTYSFVQMYGPKFGSIVERGSHMIIGRIMYKNRNVHLCKIQVHVVAQGCSTPKHLVSNCANPTGPCNFTCSDQTQELLGPSTITCGEDMKWQGQLPVCRARNWCEAPPPPDYGRIICKASASGAGFSKCRLRCARGWRGYPRAVTICRHGAWSNKLTCQKPNKLRDP